MQMDIGFGDIVYPAPERSDLPTMLDFPAARLLCYSRESTIAEKFEAMVELGALNSRMKDFYDIWLLSRQFDFDGPKLAEAIRLTFKKRGTALPVEITAFDKSFINDKHVQWAAFRNRLSMDHIPTSFTDVVLSVAVFLEPLVTALLQGHTPPTHWVASGPWVMPKEDW